jgi:hypothetical protein
MATEEPVRAPELEEAGQAYEDGRRGDIRAPMLQFYREAVERDNHYNASHAAHYLGLRGVSETVEERIQWHLRSLEHAEAVPPSQPQESFASIYLNLAFNYEILALDFYRRAGECVETLPDDDYGRLIREKLAEGIARLEVLDKPWEEG